MKKLIFILSLFFLVSCTQHSKQIPWQIVTYNSMSNMCSVTTRFDSPSEYSTCVYCTEDKLDSVKKVEYEIAVRVQKLME